MKNLNTMMYVSNAAMQINEYTHLIANSDDYYHAKAKGNKALGYIDCMITFLNTMICKENNDFTGEFDEVLDSWRKQIIQAVINKADELGESSDEIIRLCEMRDAYDE